MSYFGIEKDTTTGSAKTIDFAHHECHDGDYFCGYITGTAKGDGDFSTIYMKTPNTARWIHMYCQWSSAGAAYFRIREYPVVTANTGSHKIVTNKNRNSSNTSAVLDNETVPVANYISTDVTIADRTPSTAGDKGGLVIWEEYSGTAKQVGGSGRSEAEFILKQDRVYVFELESDAAANILSLQLYGYEHTNT
jgi:hypothetical protein